MRLFLLVATTAILSGQNLLKDLHTVSAASWTNTGSNIDDYRVELRFRAVSGLFVQPGDGSNFHCQIDGSLLLTCLQGGDGNGSGPTTAQLINGNDYRIRWQRSLSDPMTGTYRLETWNGDCTGYVLNTKPITPAGQLIVSITWNVSGSTIFSFIRGYTTLDNTGMCPVDAPIVKGDLFDWAFEDMSGGTLVSRDSHAYTLTAAGSSFANSVVYNPQSAVTGSWSVATSHGPVFKFGTINGFSGANSVSFAYPGTGVVSSYAWSMSAGTATILSGANTATPVLQCSSFGQNTVLLVVTDSLANMGTRLFDFGCSNGLITDPKFNWTMTQNSGLAVFGSHPWSWYDITESATVDTLSQLMQTAPTATAGPGLCTIPKNGPNQLSTSSIGTFITALSQAGVVGVCSGANLTGADVGHFIAIAWDSEGNATNKARFVTFINAVLDANTFVSNQFYIADPVDSKTTGKPWYRLGADYGPFNIGDGGGNILNFYEAGLGVGRLWQRTGFDAYKNQFHNFCDLTWYWSANAGFANFNSAFNWPTDFLAACATDPSYTKPVNMGIGLQGMVQRNAQAVSGVDSGFNPTVDVIAGKIDPRPATYTLRITATLAKLGASIGVNQSQWCGYLVNQIQHTHIPGLQSPGGVAANTYLYYPEDTYSQNSSILSVPNSFGLQGGSPWRGAGLGAIALSMAYDPLIDPSACNNPSLAAQLFNPVGNGGAGSGILPQIANMIFDFGRSNDAGLWGAVEYYNCINNDQTNPPCYDYNSVLHFLSSAVTYAGGGSTVLTGNNNALFTHMFYANAIANLGGINCTVQSVADNKNATLQVGCLAGALTGSTNFANISTIGLTHNSFAITGDTNTDFTKQFSNGYALCAIPSNPTDKYCTQVTVVNAHSMTAAVMYTGATDPSITNFAFVAPAITACGPLSIAHTCTPDQFNNRALSADIAAGYAWLYKQTGFTAWKTKGQYFIDKINGGAAGGAGALGAPTGAGIPYVPGSVTVVAGGTSIVGTGTQFQTKFSVCNGSQSITLADGVTNATWQTYGFASNPQRYPTFYTIPITGCADQTHATISTPWPGAGSTNTNMWYNAIDPLFSGPDGGVGNLADVLPVCASNPVPCGGGQLIGKYGKPLGMASGAGNEPIAMFNFMTTPAATTAEPRNSGARVSGGVR